MVGKTLQQYQFLEQLGAGGMGEIYKARDTRLNRFVAIKVLTSASAGDPERRRRFIQEAQAASALNHPNIITIHDIITADNADHLVMEYVQGKTLVDLIPKGGLRVPQVLKSAVQMTDALQAAHAAGIVHRDLKPGNVMVTDSGLVKILDFGLAKLADPSPVSHLNDADPDATQAIAEAPLTVEGSIIGTVSYMSPEQAQGKRVDPRSDIFSLGVVLYEMVTGVRAFAGESALSTLSSILRDEARPIMEIAPDVPPQLEQVIKRCLRKNPDDRFQTMKEVQTALGALKAESDSGMLYRARVGLEPQPAPPPPVPVPAKPVVSPLVLGIVAAVAIVLMVGLGARWWIKHRTAAAPTPPPVAVVTAPAPIAPPTPVVETPAPAPADQTLTNDSIIQLVEGKVAPGVILSQIRNADKTNFNLSTSEVVRLTKAGVTDEEIETMRNPKRPPARAVAAVAPARPSTVAPTPSTGPVASAAPAPAPEPSVAPSAPLPLRLPPEITQTVTLVDGLPIPITLSEDVPDNAEAGQPLRFTATDDVRVEGALVVAKGAAVSGEIAEGAKKKVFGGTKMTLRLLTIDAADGRKYRVRAISARGGGDGRNLRPVETNVKPKSKNVTASAGTPYIAYIDGDVTVTVRK
jgi:hypothetical protein